MASTLKRHKLKFSTLLFAALFLVVGAYSYYADEETTQAEAPPAPPAPMVHVETIQSQKVRLWTEFSGRIEAVEEVVVRPRVGGAIAEVLFEEGAAVQTGDALFLIDPRPFEAELAAAQAALESVEARAQLAEDERNRLEGLVKQRAVSQSLYDTAVSDYKVAVADINAAQARVRQAKLDLEYANIQAPIDGRVGRAEITVGNVVEAGPGAPVLTTLVSNAQVYAEFDVDEQTYIKLVRANAGRSFPVELRLSGDDTLYSGEIHAFDNRLDSTSGTIRARAIFKNKDGVLAPGMYADVRLGTPSEDTRILVDDRAVSVNQDKRFVYVVQEGVVAYREVTLGATVDGRRVVLSGLSDGDQVIVRGLQRVRPDMPVQIAETENAAN